MVAFTAFLFAAASASAALAAPTPATTSTSPYALSSVGCFSNAPPAINIVDTKSSPWMIIQRCAETCAGTGASFIGLEAGNTCYCGTSLNNGAQLLDDSECNRPCVANKGEICGGLNATSVYSVTYNSE